VDDSRYAFKRVRVTDFLKQHIIGIAIFAVITGLGGNYLYDIIKQHTPPSTRLTSASGPVSPRRPLKFFLMKESDSKARSPRTPDVPAFKYEPSEPDFVASSAHRVTLLEDPQGFEFELEDADKARFAEFTREHLGRVMMLEWGKEPLAIIRFTTTALDGCVTVSPAEKWSMTEFFYLCQLYTLENHK
jgi:hypothetical protein